MIENDESLLFHNTTQHNTHSLSLLGMEDDEYIKKGTADILYGHRCEQLGEYQKAFDLYMSGVEVLLAGAQSDRNTARQEHVRRKVLDYMRAAERLKDRIPPPSSPPASRRMSGAAAKADHDANQPAPFSSPSSTRKDAASPPSGESVSAHHHQVQSRPAVPPDAKHVHFAAPPEAQSHVPHADTRPRETPGSPSQHRQLASHPTQLGSLATPPQPSPQHQHAPVNPPPQSLLLQFDPLAPVPSSSRAQRADEGGGVPSTSASLTDESVKQLVDLTHQIIGKVREERPEEVEASLAHETQECRLMG